MLATDGSNSFAFFNYKQLEMLRNVTETNEIGFNKGDGSIYSSFGIESMNETNLYRIDGMRVVYIRITESTHVRVSYRGGGKPGISPPPPPPPK